MLSSSSDGEQATFWSNEAQILVDALKSFIVPIIQSHVLGSQFVDPPTSSPTTFPNIESAEALVTALSSFVTSQSLGQQSFTFNHRSAENDHSSANIHSSSSPHNANNPSPDINLNDTNAIAVGSEEPTIVERPLLAGALYFAHQKTMSHIRQSIFNKFPIRVLSFNEYGTQIQLHDRGGVIDIISADVTRHLSDPTNKLAEKDALNIMDNPAFFKTFCERYMGYAILSHTWLQSKPGEVTYGDWTAQRVDPESTGYLKLANFCRVAAVEHYLQFGWMDTVCINKDSSTELDESIRSMYSWYKASTVCITYLEGTATIDEMHEDRWFTRGWTLQELIAPEMLSFYNSFWQQLSVSGGNNLFDTEILAQIERAARITPTELQTFSYAPPPICRRMHWAAHRVVTRDEDAAYSLMGLFGVSMSTAYGEGAERAFLRLVKKILGSNTGNLLDLVNHGYVFRVRKSPLSTVHTSNILPHSPRAFSKYVDPAEIWRHFVPSIPITLTHLGLHVSALLLPGYLYSLTNNDIPPPEVVPYFFDIEDERYSNQANGGSWSMYLILNHTVTETTLDLGTQCFALIASVTQLGHWQGKTMSMAIKVPANNTDATNWFINPVPVTFRLDHGDPMRPIRYIPLRHLSGMYLRNLYL